MYKLVPVDSDLVFYSIPFFIITIAFEIYVSWREQLHLYHPKEALSSVGMGIGSLVINLLMKGLAYGTYTLLYERFSLFDIGWYWWSWILILFADDLTFYWQHRLSHEIRFLWASHVNHHSSRTLNLATALRQSWGELFYKYVWWLWLPLMGFQPLMVLMMMSISLVFQYTIHTDLIKKFPDWYEFFFNTPSHHRVHHASNFRYLDKNHGGIFIIWDRIFGTFALECNDEKPVYGITKNIETYNVFKIATHEFVNMWNDIKRAPTVKDKFKYIFYSPGWSHDGPDLRTRTLRKKNTHSEESNFLP